MRRERTTAGRARRVRAAIAALFLLAPASLVPACGARTGLHIAEEDAGATPPSASFCARANYRSGYSSLSIYVLLDKSGSMADDNKWDEATSALSAFVSDPAAAGLGIGLAYFPMNGCLAESYVHPAVPIAPLPGNADNIKASLAKQKLEGDTPTRLALRAAIEYARARQIANPHEEVAIALVTDGVPNACDSSIANVAETALEGVKDAPQVLTFVIGQEAASEKGLSQIAAAGGTGKPVIVGKSAQSAQKLVDALEGLRKTLGTCEYAIPSVGDAALEPSDVTASYIQTNGGAGTALSRVPSATACGAGNGFYVDDPVAPTRIVLCPVVCQLLHESAESKVSVVAGCGQHSDGGVLEGGLPDGGSCNSVVSFSCTPKCGSGQLSPAVCDGMFWTCPTGMVHSDECTTCPVVPHGCCKSDGTVGVASCVNGTWTCPPGGTLFGQPGCRPPDVCTELLPCASGQYCKVPDENCGKGSLPGQCEPIPTSCPAGGAAVCGCGGKTYPSACEAAQSGADLSISGQCSAPPGTFPCGPYFCNAQSQVCRHTLDFTKVHTQNSYQCITPPAGCSTGCGCNQCACPAGKACKESCAANGSERTLTCTVL
jgi:Mg-chelatase subunit ChlD